MQVKSANFLSPEPNGQGYQQDQVQTFKVQNQFFLHFWEQDNQHKDKYFYCSFTSLITTAILLQTSLLIWIYFSYQRDDITICFTWLQQRGTDTIKEFDKLSIGWISWTSLQVGIFLRDMIQNRESQTSLASRMGQSKLIKSPIGIFNIP